MLYFSPSRGKFNGIIKYFNVNYYSDLFSLIKVYPSSNCDGWSNSSSIVDLTDWTGMWAGNNQNASVIFYFSNKRISISHYTIMTRYGVDNMPKSWKLEGSNDNETWEYLHSVFDSEDLLTSSASKTYKVLNNGVFSFFKVSQQGTNANGKNIFHLQRLELFGSLSNKDENCILPLFICTAKLKTNLNKFVSFVLMIIF